VWRHWPRNVTVTWLLRIKEHLQPARTSGYALAPITVRAPPFDKAQTDRRGVVATNGAPIWTFGPLDAPQLLRHGEVVDFGATAGLHFVCELRPTEERFQHGRIDENGTIAAIVQPDHAAFVERQRYPPADALADLERLAVRGGDSGQAKTVAFGGVVEDVDVGVDDREKASHSFSVFPVGQGAPDAAATSGHDGVGGAGRRNQIVFTWKEVAAR